ncbi:MULTISPECIES: hypothetical protein [Tsukamurella]|uniref:Uncharacterized protein n=1 Tax=Tsukamurella strandjordii TaxID=147577 RepID=A0AA90SSE7_9ACTN|nr:MULTISPECIES: hypothetical protein [Tsukamurella]MDP0399831.1 hypothetical protein [Tsukamurella strandjordii]GIZ97430.1 hypothetical protein TTY48_20420 [Tsukamurella sp. TY48]
MRTDIMEQLTSRTLAPIYDLNKVPANVPQTWIDAARLGGPEGVRSFLDDPDNAALRETLPLMTSYIYEYAVDLFIAEFRRPDHENAKPEPVLAYAFLAHDEQEPYLTLRIGPLPWIVDYPDGYPADLKQLATVHAGFFDDWTFGGPAPVDVFKPLGGLHLEKMERKIAAADTDLFPFDFQDEHGNSVPRSELPDIHSLCPVWSLGDREWVRFLCVDRTSQQVWFVIPSEEVSREFGTASKYIDDAVGTSFSRYADA